MTILLQFLYKKRSTKKHQYNGGIVTLVNNKQLIQQNTNIMRIIIDHNLYKSVIRIIRSKY